MTAVNTSPVMTSAVIITNKLLHLPYPYIYKVYIYISEATALAWLELIEERNVGHKYLFNSTWNVQSSVMEWNSADKCYNM